jgi:uncharacterized protein
MQTLDDKLHELRRILSDLGSVLVAYSGGVDSTFLLKVAVDVLGKNVLAVTERSAIEPSQDVRQAQKFAASLGVPHLLIDARPLDDPHFANNTPDRCYWCKRRLFGRLTELAKEHGLAGVVDGTNIDDLQDYRPGMKAEAEYAVRSPLREAGLTKDEIRELSQRMKLPTWDKPASPCLASRFPYGARITVEGLTRVQRAEEHLAELGFRVLRVRDHGDIARIEVPRRDQALFFGDGIVDNVIAHLKSLGYIYVCLDLQGYRTGSMNETLANTAHG